MPSDRVARMRAALEAKFPDETATLTDEYLRSVMSAPGKSGDGKPRTFAYARDKLLRSLDFRRSFGATGIQHTELGSTLTCGSL